MTDTKTATPHNQEVKFNYLASVTLPKASMEKVKDFAGKAISSVNIPTNKGDITPIGPYFLVKAEDGHKLTTVANQSNTQVSFVVKNGKIDKLTIRLGGFISYATVDFYLESTNGHNVEIHATGEEEGRDFVVKILDLVGLDFSNNSLFGDFEYETTAFPYLKPWQYLNDDTIAEQYRRMLVKNGASAYKLTEDEVYRLTEKYDDVKLIVMVRYLNALFTMSDIKLDDIFKALRQVSKNDTSWKVTRIRNFLDNQFKNLASFGLFKWEFFDFFGFKPHPALTDIVEFERANRKKRVDDFKAIVSKYRPKEDKVFKNVKQTDKLKKNQARVDLAGHTTQPMQVMTPVDNPNEGFRSNLEKSLDRIEQVPHSPVRQVGKPVSAAQLMGEIRGGTLTPSVITASTMGDPTKLTGKVAGFEGGVDVGYTVFARNEGGDCVEKEGDFKVPPQWGTAFRPSNPFDYQALFDYRASMPVGIISLPISHFLFTKDVDIKDTIKEVLKIEEAFKSIDLSKISESARPLFECVTSTGMLVMLKEAAKKFLSMQAAQSVDEMDFLTPEPKEEPKA